MEDPSVRSEPPPRRSDVAVYGATAGGVMAAIAAAECGARTLLLEPGRHVGGMISGGLGKTDMERQEHVIGGYARRFFERVGAHYGQPIAWRFEPHVAERVLVDWLDAAGVEVRFGAALAGVAGASRGGRIRSALLVSGESFETVEAAVFVDATYEGDLLAAAGISYAVGREDRSLYGESLAGRREFLPDPHQFRAAVRADESGALARYIQPLASIGVPGQGDGKVQSYCYRICLSADAAASEPIPAPEGYEPEQYSAVEAYLRALGDRATVRDVLGIGEVPSGKTDINSGGPISTNLLGASWAYVEADRATRARIARAHHDWAQGLLYFLAHERSVPAPIRREIGRFGLPRDEFSDTDGWPHQLYVREARRMQGEHILTQRDLTVQRHKPDSIGMGGYNIDIREVQWVSCPVSRFPDVADEILQEGYLSVPVEPYEIPYRALLPRRAECSNLLVSTCLSASHVALNSFRLEPQFMMVGQAAGTAAAFAAREGGDVHDVDVGALQEHLRRDGAILGLP